LHAFFAQPRATVCVHAPHRDIAPLGEVTLRVAQNLQKRRTEPFQFGRSQIARAVKL
jgi:hypothetical protein